jgi:hypothetical protein
VQYLSNVNLRAIMAVLIRRAGGEVAITNEDLYDAMMPADGRSEPFVIEETPTGIRVSMREPETDHPANTTEMDPRAGNGR